MASIEFADRLANMWRDSRQKAGKSQEYVAKCLGLSKKTIQNWEDGTASPSFRKALEWFDAIGEPMYPYLMELLYPTEMSNLCPDSTAEEINKSLNLCVNELDEFHQRELLYLLNGAHGSSPTGSLDMVTAYLHLPLAMRVCVAQNILANYEMAKAIHIDRNDGHVEPKVSTVQKCVKTAVNAVYNGKETYTVTEEENP